MGMSSPCNSQHRGSQIPRQTCIDVPRLEVHWRPRINDHAAGKATFRDVDYVRSSRHLGWINPDIDVRKIWRLQFYLRDQVLKSRKGLFPS